MLTAIPTIPLETGYVRSHRAVPVLIDQPMSGDLPSRRFRGSLLGAMFDRGQVHHFRVEGDDGHLYLMPPHWLVGAAPVLADATVLDVVL